MQELNQENFDTFINSFDYVLSDCDGVLWKGDQALPDAPEALNFLREQGKKIIFITNNSSNTRQDYLMKCRKLGITAHLEEIYPTSYCTALYLKSQNFTKKAYIIGRAGLANELANFGINSLPIGPDPLPEDNIPAYLQSLKLDPDVGAVIIGHDHHINYLKLLKASTYLKNPDCLFIATNCDFTYPDVRDDLVYPGTGSVVKAVEAASRRSSHVVGKPTPYLFSCIQHDHPEIIPSRTVIFGDWLYSDIRLGKNVGLGATVLVLTGVSTKKDVEALAEKDPSLIPDFILPSMGHILQFKKS